MRSLRTELAVFLTAMLLCVTRTAMTQELQKLSTAKVAAAVKMVDVSLLPQNASIFFIDRQQAMTLTRGAGIMLLPVRYAVPNPGGGGSPFFQCGIFFLSSSGPAKLLITFGKDSTETESCDSLKAIGAVSGSKSQAKLPSLALIYKASTLKDSVTEPIILTFSGDGNYQLDEDFSQWIGEQKEGHTISGIRELLAKRTPDRPLHELSENFVGESRVAQEIPPKDINFAN